MSAPDTNTEKQEKKHKASLLGIRGAILFGVLMVILVIGFTIRNSNDPEGDAGLNAEDGAAASTSNTTSTGSD